MMLTICNTCICYACVCYLGYGARYVIHSVWLKIGHNNAGKCCQITKRNSSRFAAHDMLFSSVRNALSCVYLFMDFGCVSMPKYEHFVSYSIIRLKVQSHKLNTMKVSLTFVSLWYIPNECVLV